MLELCAADLYPSPRVYLGFTMCLFNDYSHIPSNDLVRGCALEHGIDFEKLNDCASKDHGENGMALLRKSVKRSGKAGVQTSCTVGASFFLYHIYHSVKLMLILFDYSVGASK